MTFTEIRNTLIDSLAAALGLDVVLSDQAAPERDVPFLIYSVTTPYAPTGEFGNHRQETVEENGRLAIIDRRQEQPSATFSFTACSENRWADPAHTRYIFGEDEAQDIVERAIGHLLHGAYNDLAAKNIVIAEVTNVGNRTTLVVDEAARRYGFDVRIRYTKTDERRDPVVESAVLNQTKE
ncbi:MAG: hypothetical protein BWY85_00252 [Firmicutes bacterium ADurb.Bin506]|nr:MAG: hypothetical protein BWY85_00252 [Firmicutes bacterium ADurb.Bin506]